MKIEEIKELIQALSNSNVDELDFENDKYSIHLAKKKPKVVTAQVADAPAIAPVMSVATTQVKEEVPQDVQEGEPVVAPLVGTFYAAPSEGADPFVSVGDRVEEGQVIGIVEAMKLMNEVEADRSGVVTEIPVSNGEMVEYGQPLVYIK